MERKILSVFVASPSDLSDERKALRDVVERLNKIYGRRTGWQIELWGWEDTLASFSRPQALINKDVENCDLFIGMMWKRWGTSSGEYSSGFEEEFTIARKRRLSGDRPEIWMLFKMVDEELHEDPGEQLKKTLDFKKKLIEGKELLFKEFENLDHFTHLIFDDLSAYLLDLYNNALKSTGTSEAESPTVKTTKSETLEPSSTCNEKNTQLIGIFSKLTRCLGNGKETEIEYWERVRAHLSTTALFSESHIGEIWGSHEANLVYRKRKEWELTFNEEWFLIRTYFGDASSVVPGWYWLFGKDLSEIEEILFFLSEHDHNTSVRKGALLSLAQSNTCPPLELTSKLLLDEDQKVVIGCLKLLRFCEDINALKLLEPLLNHPAEEVKDLALSAYIDLLYLHDPEQSFIILKDKSKVVTPAYKVSGEKLNLKISESLLISAVFEAAPRVREFAAGYLSKVGALSKEISEQILKDPDSLVRRIGFEWLLRNGEDFSLSDISKLFPRPKTSPSLLSLSRPEVTEDDIVPLVLSKKTKEELEDMVDFYSGHGNEAYEALASIHTTYVADRLRADLKDHFENLKNKSIDKLKSQYGEQASILIGRYKPDTEQFIRDTFIASAIKGIAKLDHKSDIDIAREYIGKVKYGMADDSCISIIEKYGGTGDIERLIDVAKKTYGSTREKAVSVAIKLSSDPQKLIPELVHSQDKNISEIAVDQIPSLGRESSIGLAKELLYSENDNVRLLAARIISKDLDRNGVEQILNDYVESPTYYYNVVHALDRYLYAPSKFKNSSSGVWWL
jgi:hypothetical protein